jgi:hypothetical protein
LTIALISFRKSGAVPHRFVVGELNAALLETGLLQEL